MADTDSDELTKKLRELLTEKDESYASLISSMSKFNKSITESNKENSIFSGIIKKQRAQYTDNKQILDDYNKALIQVSKELDEFGNELTEAVKEQKAITAAKARDEALEAVDRKNARASIQNFAVGALSATQSLVTGVATATTDLIKSMQTNSGGVGVATGALKYAVDGIAGSVSLASSAISGIGEFAQLNSRTWKGKLAGLISEGLGSLLGSSVKVLSDTAKVGIEILSKEVEKAMDTYTTAAAAGAIFINGVRDLQTAAHSAGLSIVTMSNIIKNNAETLYTSGLNLGQATKKISDVFISGGDGFKRSLFNLGYSFEEQGALISETMKYLSIAGMDLRSLDNNTIREETEKYAINLKTISAITGEDAKKRMEDARRASANSLVQARLAQMTPEARRQFTADLATVPKEIATAVLQQRFLGTIVDKNAAIMLSLAPELHGVVRNMSSALGQGDGVMGQLREQFATTYQTAVQSGKFAELGLSTMAGVQGTATDVETNLLQNLTLALQSGAKVAGAAAEIATGLTAMKETTDKTTDNLGKLKTQAELLTSTLEKQVNEHLKDYSNLLVKVNDVMHKFVNEAGDYIASLRGGNDTGPPAESNIGGTIGGITGTGAGIVGGGIAGKFAGRLAGAAFGATVGSSIPIIGTAIGGIAGFVFGEALSDVGEKLGNKIGNKVGEYFRSKPPAPENPSDSATAESIPGAARGNILSGPSNGFMAMLHGTEAVIPLPDGRTVPVNLSMPKNINYAAPTNSDRMLFARDIKLDNLSLAVKDIKNTVADSKENMTTLVIPQDFKSSLEMSNNAIREAMREQVSIIRDHNEKLDRLLTVATDTRYINQQLLNATY